MATATKKRGSTANAIREMLAAGKEPKEIQEALKLKHASMIYTIRSKGKKKRRKMAGNPSSDSNGGLSLEHLLAAKKLCESVGGVEPALFALKALEKLS